MADNPLSTFLPDRAATGFFPQMKPRRRFQDREGSANVPLDVMRGRLAGMLGTPTDLANIFRSPMPTEMFGETNYEPAQQLPYGSEYFLKNLPLAPTSRVGEVAGQAGSFVPLNPMPAARAAAAGAKALGPTAGRMAEQYLTRTGGILPLDVYHGSPHRFPPTATNPLGEFDASKIGTGEGAQAYGHGLYLAEQPDVASSYRNVHANRPGNTGPKYTVDGVEFVPKTADEKQMYAIVQMGDQQVISQYANQLKNMSGGNSDSARNYADILNRMNSLLESGSKVTPSGGSLYKVDLPDKQIAKMLDFDKPLSEQSKEVQAAMDKAFQLHLGRIPQVNKDTFTGAQAYEMLTGGASGMQGYENIAAQGSKALRQAGIPGIKYLDQGSRGTGKGTSNFVIFPGEEKSLTILERNGQPGQNSLKSFIK
jgi:hypothetical protein